MWEDQVFDPMKQRTIVCFTPYGEDWTWMIQELTAPDVRWIFMSDLADRPWKRRLRRAAFIKPISGFLTALTARREKAALLITMDPRLSFWAEFWCILLFVKVEHMAFSFNFDELPKGWKRLLFGFAFKRIDLMRVHSRMEIRLYRDYFGIPEERLKLGLWGVNMPDFEPKDALEPGDYLCAVGGNARDYETLLAAGLLAPEIPMVWVVRPENVAGMNLPAHIRVVTNVPHPEAMNYLVHSRAMVLPLKSAETPCGHVTLVSAMYLRKAILATDSAGISDYVEEGVTGMLCRPGDAEDLARCMRAMWRDREMLDRMGENGLRFAEAYCSEGNVRREMIDYLALRGLAASPTDDGKLKQNMLEE